jgi:hypothetical protein
MDSRFVVFRFKRFGFAKNQRESYFFHDRYKIENDFAINL